MPGVALATVVVPSYDEALAFYVDVLGFVLLEDTPVERGKRWVVVGPSEGRGAALLLAQAEGRRQRERIGDQTGGRVALFLVTEDFERDYGQMTARRVRFLEEPREEAYGTVAVFVDPYGNRWDLLEPAAPGHVVASATSSSPSPHGGSKPAR